MRSRWLLFVLLTVCLGGGVIASVIGTVPSEPRGKIQSSPTALDSFGVVASVLRHQRCLNCHPSGDRPHVAEDRHVHAMNVQRGPEGEGMPGLHCSACHQEENQPHAGVPGAPHWHLAPRSMGWEGLDDHDLAAALIDKTKNGDRSFKQLIEHMEKDPLVSWAWNPGNGRSIPPVDRETFISELKKWFEAGAPLPPKGKTTF